MAARRYRRRGCSQFISSGGQHERRDTAVGTRWIFLHDLRSMQQNSYQPPDGQWAKRTVHSSPYRTRGSAS